MRRAVIYAPGDVRFETRPDPKIIHPVGMRRRIVVQNLDKESIVYI
jgi:hypothetical protein